MELPKNYTEIRWGKNGDELVIGIPGQIPESVLRPLLEDEYLTAVAWHMDGYSLVNYSMDKFRKSSLVPLNVVSEEFVHPMREHFAARDLGRVAFNPIFRDIQKEGPLFAGKKHKPLTESVG
jgi:hypothetical protein